MKKLNFKKFNGFVRNEVSQFVVRYFWYVNSIIFLASLVVLYFFVRTYYYSPEQEFGFMQTNISNISYVPINKEQLNGVNEAYTRKLEYTLELPRSLRDPF